MISRFLGKIDFEHALQLEKEIVSRVRQGGAGEVLGFESDCVITLGKRSSPADLTGDAGALAKFRIIKVDRGGQATLHNPGQLILFPVFDIRALGAQSWVNYLLQVSMQTLREFGVKALCRAGAPGLFTDQGKIASIGLRIRDGVSTHGMAINVINDLTDFGAIRTCGVTKAPMDRLGRQTPGSVFEVWMKFFNDGLTSSRNLTNLECSSRDVRL